MEIHRVNYIPPVNVSFPNSTTAAFRGVDLLAFGLGGSSQCGQSTFCASLPPP